MYKQLTNVTARALVAIAVGASIVLAGAWSISGGANESVANPNGKANVESSVPIHLAGCQTRGCT